jgi:mono/diheme cytochrome c family protein
LTLRLLSAAALGLGLLALAPLSLPASAQDEDWDNLPPGEHRELVFALCSGCHSAKLVAQQGLNRHRWDKLLDWMIEEQGMAELDAETREQVLDYLETELGEDHRG